MSVKQLWRIGAAGFSYGLFAIGAILPAALSLILFTVPCSQYQRQTITRAFIRLMCLSYVHFMQLVWLYRYRVHRRNVTDIRGHLIIANHPMLIDALFAMAYVRDVCCIVKPALAANPFTRLTIKAAGFKLANDDNLLQSACEALARGENLLIFPEGTRNEYDDQLAFKRGAANIAVMAQCPILPIVFYCSPRMLQKGEKWWQLPEQPAQIDIVIEPSLKVPECVDASLPRTRQYRLLTEFLIEYYRSRLADPVCEIAQYHRPKA